VGDEADCGYRLPKSGQGALSRVSIVWYEYLIGARNSRADSKKTTKGFIIREMPLTIRGCIMHASTYI